MTSRRPVNRVSPRLRPSDRGTSRPAPAGADPARSGADKARGRSKPSRGRPAPQPRPAAASGPAAPDPAAGRARAPRRRSRAPRQQSGGPRQRSWVLPVGLAVAAAALTAFAVVAAFRPGVSDGNAAFVDTEATEQVQAAAGAALKTVYSYDAAAIAGDKGAAAYKDAVHKVVTGTMLADFDKFADTTVSAIQQAQSTATATADPIGVTLLTNDRAELLVDLTVSASRNGVPQESASGPIVLRMQKINGRWLAAEITDR
ncbi:hypothetical protein [Nocardia sp. alder85J]|uniref:hypothetical protein n=1 Tax=Nocardia sp. alder85J TaxID=2862949 RepID=UPI00225B99D3|nr:hypothetical protein [Nocardia sp. alder85J]MCX4097821.1 hypothetical protein [Nocardia sp. alder85J]